MLRENHVACDPLGVGMAVDEFVRTPNGTDLVKRERLIFYRKQSGGIGFGYVRVRDRSTRMLYLADRNRRARSSPSNPTQFVWVRYEDLFFTLIPFKQPHIAHILTPGC